MASMLALTVGVAGTLLAAAPAGASPTGTVTIMARHDIDASISITTGPDGNLWFTSASGPSIGRLTPGGTITSFLTPYADHIVAGPDGALWFTSDKAIGRITTTGDVSSFPLPALTDPSANPRAITAGPDGALWFTLTGYPQNVGRITTGGAVSIFSVGTVGYPNDITTGADGNLWFTAPSAVGRITPAGVVTAFPMTMTGGGGPIASGPDGNLWVSTATNAITRLATSGTKTTFTDTAPSSPDVNDPQSIAVGADGALWFTNHGNGTIGRMTTAGAMSHVTDPTIHGPTAIAAGPDGALWFTQISNQGYPEQQDSIGRVTTGGVVTNIASNGVRPKGGFTAGPDGAVWFVSGTANTIVRLTTSGAVSAFTDPSINASGGITAGPDGNVWFTNGATNTIGRVTPAGVVTAFADASINGPGAIAAGPDGNLWFTNGGNDTIGRITTAGVVSSFAAGGAVGLTDIAAGPDGNMWFTATTVASIGRITPAGAVTSFTSGAIAHPVSIVTGPDGNLWFTNVYEYYQGSGLFCRGSWGATYSIGKITPAGVASTVLTSSQDARIAEPLDIVSGRDGNLWFTNAGLPGSCVNGFPVTDYHVSIARITPAGSLSTIVDPQVTGPRALAVGPDGNLWFRADERSIARVAVDATPGPPSGASAVAGDQQATVSWAAPADDGGSPISGYTVTASPGGATCTWTSGPLSCTVTGLTDGTSYTFTVRAENSEGSGLASAPSNAVTPSGVPKVLAFPTAEPGDGTARVWWWPANGNGSPVTGFVVTPYLDGSPLPPQTFDSPVNAATVTGLTNGSTYTFTIAAVNANGTGPASGATAPIVVGAPTTPPNVVARPANGAATISWGASAPNAAPVTGYLVTTLGGAEICTTSGATTCTVAGLTNGASYRFRVTATNAVGTSSASRWTTPVTVGTPTAPAFVTARSGNFAASLSFWPPNDNGSPITSYTITPYENGVARTPQVIAAGAPVVATGLGNGVTYTFTVSATNAVGTGQTSAMTPPVEVGTQPPPTGVSAWASGSSLGVSWTTKSNFTPPIVEFQITVYRDGVKTSTCFAANNQTSSLCGPLPSGSGYTARVAALNNYGAGTLSAPSNAVTIP